MENADFYEAVAAGDVDLWANGWFPLHDPLLTAHEGAERVGTQVDGGALQGYFADLATATGAGIGGLADLAHPEVAARFDTDGDGKADLVGCNVGWSCAEIIDHHIEVYGLGATVEQVQGDYSALMSEVAARYQEDLPVLFYTWTPNWTIGHLVPGRDVTWLQTPFPSLPPRLVGPRGGHPRGRRCGVRQRPVRNGLAAQRHRRRRQLGVPGGQPAGPPAAGGRHHPAGGHPRPERGDGHRGGRPRGHHRRGGGVGCPQRGGGRQVAEPGRPRLRARRPGRNGHRRPHRPARDPGRRQGAATVRDLREPALRGLRGGVDLRHRRRHRRQGGVARRGHGGQADRRGGPAAPRTWRWEAST